MKRFTFLALLLAGVTGNALAESECMSNFSYEGSNFKGRTFRTKAFVGNVKLPDAMKRAARHISLNGFQINSSDLNLGIISASQPVSYSQGKTVPLSVSFEEEKGGVLMNFSYSTSGGVTSPVDAVQKFFCAVTAEVEGKKK